MENQSHFTPPSAAPSTPSTPPTPSSAPAKKTGCRFSLWRLGFGLFIVLIGLSLLAQSLGWNWSINADVWRLWPIFIIFAGLSMITNHRWTNAVFVIIIVLACAWFFLSGFANMPFGDHHVSWNQPREIITTPIAVVKESTAVDASIDINTGAGKLTIAGAAGTLVGGSYVSNIGDLKTSSALTGTTQTITLSTTSTNVWRLFGRWQNDLSLTLAPDLPTTLSIDGGAMDMNLDLSAVPVKDLRIDTGASSIDLMAGDLVESGKLDINSGASSIDISLPKTLGVDLNLVAGASGKTLPDFSKISENYYRSTNYDAATKKLDVQINAGASSIDFSWR